MSSSYIYKTQLPPGRGQWFVYNMFRMACYTISDHQWKPDQLGEETWLWEGLSTVGTQIFKQDGALTKIPPWFYPQQRIHIFIYFWPRLTLKVFLHQTMNLVKAPVILTMEIHT